jgi:hypothetical protein
MSSFEDFAGGQITEDQAVKTARIVLSMYEFAAEDEDVKRGIAVGMIQRFENAAHNATLMKDALKAELKKMEEVCDE